VGLPFVPRRSRIPQGEADMSNQCHHGHLARVCSQCDAEDRIGDLTRELAAMTIRLDNAHIALENVRQQRDEAQAELARLTAGNRLVPIEEVCRQMADTFNRELNCPKP